LDREARHAFPPLPPQAWPRKRGGGFCVEWADRTGPAPCPAPATRERRFLANPAHKRTGRRRGDSSINNA